MPSLQDNFEQLWQRLRYGRGLSHTGDDPVYYLVFHPSEMLEVKRRIRQWTAALKKQDWTMETFSMAEAIKEIFAANEFRDLWLASEEGKRFDAEAIQQVNKQLESALLEEGALKKRLQEKLQSIKVWVEAQAKSAYGSLGSTAQGKVRSRSTSGSRSTPNARSTANRSWSGFRRNSRRRHSAPS